MRLLSLMVLTAALLGLGPRTLPAASPEELPSWEGLAGRPVRTAKTVAGEPSSVLRALDRLSASVAPRLQPRLKAAGLAYPPRDVFLRVFKFEAEVELWARDDLSRPFTLVTTYEALEVPMNYRLRRASTSSDVGPKRQEGDCRVPEGVYQLLYHNPWSAFHVSLAVGYPSVADAVLARRAGTIDERGERAILAWWDGHDRRVRERLLEGSPSLWNDPAVKPLGSQIFVHGKDTSVGCIPVGDPAAEELFVLTDARRVGGTELHIFPFRFDRPEYAEPRRRLEELMPELRPFWAGLQAVYQSFERAHVPPAVGVDPTTGCYVVPPRSDSLKG